MPGAPVPYAQQEGHGARNRGERLIVIANPRAGGGRAGDRRDRIERAVERSFEQGKVWWTEGPGHASELARRAAAEGDIVAALGGDGTCHEVVNGLFQGEIPVNRKAIFTVLPAGTGGDLVRSLEIPASLDDALWVASTGMTLHLDVGVMRWPNRRRLFINVAGFGANAEVCRRVNATDKARGGKGSFLPAIFSTVRDFRPQPVQWSWEGPDGAGSTNFETFAAFCANGHYCGAGLHVGQGGSMADGVFELTLVPPLGTLQALTLAPRFYSGSFWTAPGMRRVRVHRVRIDSPIALETDGEPQGEGPVEISVIPHILQVRGGWLRPPALPEQG